MVGNALVEIHSIELESRAAHVQDLGPFRWRNITRPIGVLERGETAGIIPRPWHLWLNPGYRAGNVVIGCAIEQQPGIKRTLALIKRQVERPLSPFGNGGCLR